LLTHLIFRKTERARAHDILLEPSGVTIEDLLLVKESVGVGEGRDKRARRVFEAENDDLRIGCFDALDHRIVAATGADDAFRRGRRSCSSSPPRRMRSRPSRPR